MAVMDTYTPAPRPRADYEIWEVRLPRRKIYQLMVRRADLRGWLPEGTRSSDMAVVVARQVELEEGGS
jgi:hypothetical protein